jgi:hypothetical protein
MEKTKIISLGIIIVLIINIYIAIELKNLKHDVKVIGNDIRNMSYAF